MAVNAEAEDDVLVMSLRLKSGRFESSISVPLFASEEDKRRFVDSWLALMEAGLRCTDIRKKEAQ